MTMDMLDGYRRYFERCPPIHLLAAAYVGYKPKINPPAPPLPDIED